MNAMAHLKLDLKSQNSSKNILLSSFLLDLLFLLKFSVAACTSKLILTKKVTLSDIKGLKSYKKRLN